MLENIYDINNIIAVKFKENYQDYFKEEVLKELKNIEYFNNTYYFLNREIIKNTDDTYLEIYEDAILGIKLFERIIKSENVSLPNFLEESFFYNLEGLTDEEIAKGLVGSSKLFYNFQIINKNEKIKTKNLGIKKVG